MTKEQKLTLELCKFRNPDENKIKSILNDKPDLSITLGYLLINRVAGAAYKTICKIKAEKLFDKLFIVILKRVYMNCQEQTRNYKKAVSAMGTILSDCKGKYAMLKGALLCELYPEGVRTSNDIDLLIEKDDLTVIEDALKAAGLKQGNIKNGVFIPASRKQIIFASMMNGETVPYVLKTGDTEFPMIEIDLNFSLGYKNEASDRVHTMLSSVKHRKYPDLELETLSSCDFLIHLCAHLHKEATAYPWVIMRRDLSIYKFMDIYMIISDYGKTAFDKLAHRMRKVHCENECWYALTYTKKVFDINNPALDEFLVSNTPSDPEYLHRVDKPDEKKTLIYTEKDPVERLFAIDRKKLLMEDEKDETPT